MKKKLALVVGMLMLSAVLFAACGMPGYVSNPPETRDELVTKLTEEGYTVEDGSSMGVADMVMATKSNINLNSLEALSDLNQTLKMEVVTVLYFETEEAAKAAYEEQKEEQKSQEAKDLIKKAKESGVKISTSISQKGKTVSTYGVTSGKLKDYMAFAMGALGDLGDLFG